ncbi:AAA family ATPase [Desulfovibrio sulfodismutans]|uniref:AAA family ATPase n=1 Tax=Desulfolutivibrio sulfodismutans TaxID=63561 RepID=A0A7K3NPM1_9BACT|nr:ATP-binding protein [Desulfolutivibrio sulfodismutans]NDY58156.1 AAA family ATPase [Desulfolutivibrio sulfodismutans]QLA12282.1 AAA family ATPase [Desulfolutivibrio sulfodismutans DSM 3696]
MITKIKIHGFKSICNFELNLGKINVFIGSNGSGKSNILEAIGVLSAAASGRVDDESLIRRGVRPGLPRLYKSSFKSERTSPHIFFTAENENTSYSVSLHNPLKDPKSAWSYKTENLRSKDTTIVSRGVKSSHRFDPYQGLAALRIVDLGETDNATKLLSTLREYAIYTPNTPTLRGVTPDLQSREPIGLSGGRLAEALRELQRIASKDEDLQEKLDEFYSTLEWASHIDTKLTANDLLSPSVPRTKYLIRFTDRYMVDKRNTLTAFDASEGALYVIFLSILSLSPFIPSLIAVDNLDQSLNPRLTKALIGMMCDLTINHWEDQQILFTSHNPAALDGLPLDNPNINLFSVDRDNYGHTIANKIDLTDAVKELCRKNDWPLSRLWMMGHLGGVPNV